VPRAPDDERPDLGPCCACGRDRPDARNLLMLHRRAPVPGSGWGCLACGAPADGAVAVVCDDCLPLGEAGLRWVVLGMAAEKRRAPISECGGPFGHDESRHPELADLRRLKEVMGRGEDVH